MKNCFIASCAAAFILSFSPICGYSQTGTEETPETAENEQVIVEREAITLIDPTQYQIPLQLLPSKFVTVVAPKTGVIDDLNVKTGEKLTPQSELFRLESDSQELKVKRAEAQVALQELKVKQAKDDDAKAIAEAELKVAQADLELAKYELDQLTRRTEWDVEVFRVHVLNGQFVTAYQKIVDIGDPSIMTVEIPVNREDVEEGGTLTVKVEDTEVEGKVVSVLPPGKTFEPLRDLYDSLASVILEFDNRGRQLKAGQAVYVSTIPRENVAEVANSSISAGEEGKRKVQVIRDNTVRDISISVLAPVGSDRSYISGAFQDDDELILATSQPLEDGTQLAPKYAEGQAGRPGATTRGSGTRPSNAGF